MFSCIQIEYGETRFSSPYSVQMRENMDQNNFKYARFSRSESSQHIVGEADRKIQNKYNFHPV